MYANGVGIKEEESHVVEMEDETRIVFLLHKTQQRICVNKDTGKTIYA